ncbi:MAG: NADP-dependent phosphogluconate dehydrogenase [archaeon]
MAMALIGLGVMGSNLAQNFAEKGYPLHIWNRTTEKTIELAESIKKEKYARNLIPVKGDLKELVKLVGQTGIYFIMIKAGNPTISVVNTLLPLLKPGAVIVDLANSNFHDTISLEKKVSEKKIHFFGVGVSGGETGARYGPSIMPGGDKSEYDKILKKPLEAISAKARDKKPCVTYCGKHGAGHFVKMVHNGIEYADMELIAEAYDLMFSIGLSAPEIAKIFSRWNHGILKSYLIEITAEVLSQKDPGGKGYLVDSILDRAAMKGTGTWTIMSSLEIESGVVPIPSIFAAVSSRAISFGKERRTKLSKLIGLDHAKYKGDKKKLIDDLEYALYLGKIASYTQGIDLIQAGDKVYGFGGIDIAKIAQIWRAGCIIRAEFLDDITKEYETNPEIISLLAALKFSKVINEKFLSLNKVCIAATELGVPFMAFDSSRNFLLQSFSNRLPANLIQGLRDYFGAHTYERTDKKGNFHTDWSGDRHESQD